MSLWQIYLRPHTLAEAIQALTSAPQPALPIAGGTDLLLDLRQGRHTPVHTLVDLTEVTEMTAIELRDNALYIGAAVPVSRIARDPLVGAHAQALAEAANLIAGPQVRNVATLGGNVAHALPAADGTIALTALNAQVSVAGLEAVRRLPLTELFLGPGQSALRPGELIVGFHLPLCRAGQASAFQRVMRAQGIALPILNLAVWLERQANRMTDIHLAVGPSGPTPRRLEATEFVLRGQEFSEALLETALETLLHEAHFRSSPHRATADYRRRVVAVLLRAALTNAWNRAGKSLEFNL